MSDKAHPDWKWENQPDTLLSDPCANGACERCFGGFGAGRICGHPCHCDHCQNDEPCYTHFPPPSKQAEPHSDFTFCDPIEACEDCMAARSIKEPKA